MNYVEFLAAQFAHFRRVANSLGDSPKSLAWHRAKIEGFAQGYFEGKGWNSNEQLNALADFSAKIWFANLN